MKRIDFVSVLKIVISVCIIIFSCLHLLGVWDNAADVSVPLLGVLIIMQSVREWNKKRVTAIAGLCAALFIIVCTAVRFL